MRPSSSQTKVAIIGLGHIGQAVAANLVKGGHAVTLASRDQSKAEDLAKELGSLACARSMREAMLESDLVIPALYFQTLKDFLPTYSTELAGKVILDVTNPIEPDGNGGFRKIIGEKESAARILSALVPPSAKLVKALGSLGVGSLSGEAFAQPERKVLFYASDSTNSNMRVEEIISASGFDPLYIGGLDSAIRMEVMGDLHQFGELGKTVTLAEAKSQL